MIKYFRHLSLSQKLHAIVKTPCIIAVWPKFYETKKDFDRDRLIEKAKGIRVTQAMDGGLTGIGIGSLLLGFIKKKNVLKISETPSFWKDLVQVIRAPIDSLDLRITGVIFTVLGGIGLWKRGKEIKKTKDDIVKLGPEEVILPPGVSLNMPSMEGEHVVRFKKSCIPCANKSL